MKQKQLINHCRVGRMLVALLALTLLPMGAWADYTYGGQSLTFYSQGESGPNYYYSGSENNQVTEWNVTATGEFATYQASTFQYSDFEDLRLTYVKSLKGTISNFTFVGGINNSNFVNMKVYRLATQDATTRTLIGSITIGGNIDNPTYTYVAENGASQSFNNEYIQLAFERSSDVDQPTIYTTAINSITLTFNGTAYGLTVGGTAVTSDNYSDVFGNGKVSFTPANDAVSPATPATLTLNAIESSFTGTAANDAFIKCTEDITSLTVHLKGESELTLGNNNSSVFSGTAVTFTKDENENFVHSLKVFVPENWTGNLYNNGTTAINATYNDHLYLEAGDAQYYYLIQTLSCCEFNSHMGDQYLMFNLTEPQTSNDDVELHYSINYVDANLQDVSNAVYESGTELPLYGPCTVNAYATSGGGTSEVSTAYYLGLSTNAIRTTLGTSVAPPTVVPALSDDIELIISETTSSGVTPVYDSTSGLITTSTTVTGEATCSVKFDCSAATTLGINVLNDTDENEKYELGDFTLTVREPGLFVAGVKVTTDNALEITGGNITEGTVSYDANENTLTLDNATIAGQIICSYDALTVHLIGYNTITPQDGQSPFVYSNPGTGSLTFATNENPNGSRLEAKDVTSIEALGLGYAVSNTFETRTTEQGSVIGVGVEAEDGWKVVIFKNNPNYTDRTIIWNFKNYNLFIGGSRVTSDNLQGSGYMNYDPDTHTLPISYSTEYAVKSGMEELIIEVSENSGVVSSEKPAICFEAMTGGPSSGTLKFVKAADAGMASITLTANGTNESTNETYKAIEGFSAANIILEDGLSLTSHATMAEALTATSVTIANYSESYDIRIAGITVTDGNKDNVLGDNLPEGVSVGSVSYDATTNTLTLNNASIIPDNELVGIIYEGEDDLTIKLIGTNTVKGVGGCSAIAYDGGQLDTPPTLTFTNGGTQACSLQLEAQDESVIDAFTNISHEGLFMLNDEIVGVDVPSTYITTFTSTLLAGGTGTSDDPFLIETKEDLAAFAQYVNTGVITTEYVKLNGNINCSELTGFMPIGTSDYPFTGTFTNSDNYTISNLNCTTAGADGYIGLFGVVGLNGATSVAGSVSGLILDNCSFSGGSVGGAIAGYLSYGTISHCMVTNSSVTTNSGDGPTSAGIVGESFGTITNCTVSGSEITATTSVGSYSTTAGGIVGTNGGTISNCEVTGTTENPTLISSINNGDSSEPYRQAGGIVGDCVDDNGVTITISGNSVTGATTVDCEDTGNAAQAGSIIGRRNNNNITLTNNFYEYTVETIIKNNNVTDERTGYAQRGSGDFVETQTNVYTDITANNGAVMYTKILTLPAESALGAVMGDEGDFYAYAEGDAYGILVAPGHPVKVKVIPGDDCSISDISVTYGTDQTAAIALTKTEEGTSFYTISEMPDANATLNVTFSQAYDLWIGETQVTSTNAAHILGEENTTVTFAITGNKEDGYVNTLTLNNASLTQRVVSGLDNLTVLLKGTNTIAIADSSPVFKSTESTATLTITKEGENASLTISNQLDGGTSGNKFPLIWNFASLDYSTAGLYLNTSIPTKYTSGTVTTTGFSGEDITANGLFGLYNRSSWESPFSATFSTVPSYQLWVADTQVTDNNKNNITGTDTPQVTFTPAENTNAAKLSLISAALQGHVISGVGDLNIYFSGDNSIEGTDTASVIRSIDTTAKLTFSSANNSKLELSQPDINDAYSSIRGFGSMELGDNVCIENQLTDPVSYSTNPDLGLVDDLDKQTPIHNLTMSSAYQLWVSGEQVSYANQNSICQGSVGEGKIRFDGDHTLTLDNVPDIVFNGTSSFIKTSMDLTINLVGESYFDCGSSTFISKLDNDNSDYTVTFTTSATNPGMLTLQAGSDFVGFEKAFENKLAWKPAGYYDETDQNAPAAWIAQPSLGLKVGDIYVTTDNADNILGEDLTVEGSVASVSYNPETYTLTLNNAELTSPIHWVTDADLTIELKGTNSMNTTNGVCITSEYSKVLSFTGGGDNCSLEFSRVEDYHFFSGFSNAETPSMGTGMYWIPTWDNNGQKMTSVLITNSILGGGKGTEGSPFIISTFEHLKTFAKYVNDGILSTEYIKLGGSIDCTNQTGFEPIGNNTNTFIGTFDGGDNSITGLIFSATNPDGVAGLFGNIGSYNSNNDVITRGTVKNLTLNGCQFGNGARNGAIAGYLDYGTIENCRVTSCTISSGNPISTYSGGIIGMVNDGVVKDCDVDGGEINSSTTSSGGDVYAGGIVASASGSSEINGCTVSDVSINSTGYNQNSYSGGIVGYSEATISGNSVEGTTTVNNINNNNDNVFVGAIVANSVEGSLENNYYYFTVNTQTKIGNNNPVVKSGYTQRAVGNRIYNEQTEQYEDAPDVTEDNGAMMYTLKVTFPTVTGATVTKDGNYYSYDETGMNIAPGQTATMIVEPSEGYAISSFTATNVDDEDISSEALSENRTRYSFEMPNEAVAVNVTCNQVYDLWIGETQVTSANAGHILGEENTTVTFSVTGNEAEGFVNTLTLNGATLTDPVKIGLANLTIDVQGTNSITTNTTCIQNTAGDNNVPSLTFKSSGDEVGNLTLTNSDEDYTGVISESYYGHFTINQELALVMLRYGEYTSDSYYFTAGEVHDAQLLPFYGVQVGNMQIHSGNAEDVFGDGTVSFNKTTNTLTLNDANKGALSTWLPELKVELVGNNKLSEGSSYPVLRSLNDAKVTIKIQSTGTTKGSLTMSQPYTEDGDFYDGNVTVSIIEPLRVISGSLTGNDGNANTVVIGEPYNLWIAGTQVTSANASNILGDDLSEEGSVASVSFDAAENTLTLNGATITPESEVSGIAYMGKDDLIISLKGANRVEGSMGCAAIAYNGESNTPPTLTFVKGDAEGSCSLQLVATDEATIFGFGEVSCIGLIMFDEVIDDGVHTASIVGYPVLDVTEDVTFADGQKWASYYNATQSFLLPEGYMAYIVTEVGETSVAIAPINYVPMTVPVLIEKDSETTTGNTSAEGNLLRGAAEDVDVSEIDGTVYGLHNNKMMRVNQGTIPAHRAYLVADEAVARELAILFGEGELTTVRETLTDAAGSGDWYTIDGRKLQKKPTKKGLYINNGHTVVIK